MKNTVIILLLFSSLIVSGQDTISHIYGGCINSGLKLGNDDPCPQGIYFDYDNDSLNIFGTIGANCCGSHLAIIKSYRDTIFISTLDTGLLCNCGCLYCFNIRIPAYITDTIVSLNGMIYSTTKNFSSITDKHEGNFALVPNPVKNNLNIIIGDDIEDLALIELIDSRGILIKTMRVNSEKRIDMDLSDLKSGAYFVRFKLKNQNSFTRTIVKK